MKITNNQYQEIANEFNHVQEIEHLAELMNYVMRLIYKDAKINFDKYGLNYYAFHHPKKYTEFQVPKNNGGFRTINAPIPTLKLMQVCINQILRSKFKAYHASHGFLPRKNIVTNANGHIGKGYVLNVDIEDFFGSIGFRRVKTVVGLEPFNLKEEREGIGFLVSNLCCKDGSLPQGAPTSPLLTNIVCQRLDRKLFQLSQRTNTKYSRYADDITFSSNRDEFNLGFINELRDIINEEGFQLNDGKTRIQDWTERQVVTGLVVNRKVNVSRNYIKKIRAILHNTEKHGIEYAQHIFSLNWNKNAINPPLVQKSLKGQIEYLGMVRGRQDSIYTKYKKQYHEVFDNIYINYRYVSDNKVRERLIAENKKMEAILISDGVKQEERFIEYCTHAYKQIELLLNYYYYSIMSLEEFKEELHIQTNYNKGNAKNVTNIGEIPTAIKIFLFEKCFYYKEGVFYDSVIKKIELIRHDDIHPYNQMIKDDEVILKQYYDLQKKEIDQIDRDGNRIEKNKVEKKIEKQGKAILFLREGDFAKVKEAVIDVSEKIKNQLKQYNGN